MRDYELVTIISPEVSDDNLPTIMERVTQFITSRGGSVAEVNPWGRRKLAYPIKRFLEGHYVLTQFKLEPRLTAELEANLGLQEQVLRHLLVRLGE